MLFDSKLYRNNLAKNVNIGSFMAEVLNVNSQTYNVDVLYRY